MHILKHIFQPSTQAACLEVIGVIRGFLFKNLPPDTCWGAITGPDPAALLPAAKL